MANFTTPNGMKIDNYYNNYDPAKHYEQLFMSDVRPMLASEINEMQFLGPARHKAHASSLYKAGDMVAGAPIALYAATGLLMEMAGRL